MSNMEFEHLGCLNKTRWGQASWPMAQLCHPAPEAHMRLLQPLSWTPSLTRKHLFQEVLLCFIPICLWKFCLARQMESCFGSWFLHGLFCGDTFPFHTPDSCVGSAFINQTDCICLMEMQAQCHKLWLFVSFSYHDRKNWLQVSFLWNFSIW